MTQFRNINGSLVIISAQFYADVASELLDSALHSLFSGMELSKVSDMKELESAEGRVCSLELPARSEVPNLRHIERVTVIRVPGAFEVPATASFVCQNYPNVAGVVALGCVVKGQTTHFEHVCEQSIRGLSKVAMKYQVPLGMGIITALDMSQANYRASRSGKDVGGSAARACLCLAEIYRTLFPPELR